MFPVAVHHLAAQTAGPAWQRGAMGSRMSGEKQLLNAATEKMSPLEEAPRLVMQRDWATSTGAVKRIFAPAILLALALAFGGFTGVTELTNLAEN